MDMEKIRQMVREQGVDLAVQGLVCLPWGLKKYTGFITRCQRKDGAMVYVAIIQHKDFHCSKSFKTKAKADQYICETNVREGLPIRNRFTIFNDRVLVDLPGNKLLICDYEDLYLVETHTWCFANGYAVTCTSCSPSTGILYWPGV